jgi:hypothetical protein
LIYNEREYALYSTTVGSGQDFPSGTLYAGWNGQFPMLINGETKFGKYPLIVGIGYPSLQAYPKERTRDYTIPIEGNVEGEGAEDFYRFIVDKVNLLLKRIMLWMPHARHCADILRRAFYTLCDV